MQYYKKTEQATGYWDIIKARMDKHFDSVIPFHTVKHRANGDIPGILKAQDVFVEEDGYIVLKNQSKPYRPAY